MAWLAEVRQRLTVPNRHWLSSLRFRCFSTVLCLAAIISFGRAIDLHSQRPPRRSYEYYGSFMDIWPLMMVCWCAFWNAFNATWIYKSRRPMHPGWNVGVELITWNGLVITNIFAMLIDSPLERPSYYEWTAPIPFELAGIVITWIVFIVHVLLFIGACCDTHYRRMKNRKAILICHHCHMKLDKQLAGYLEAQEAPGDRLPAYPLSAHEVALTEQEKNAQQV